MWQIERLGWKLDLIAAVDARVKAPSSALPPPADWAAMNATDDEYQRAYRKFCSGGGMAMTEREWELVALGGPRGIPANLRDRCLRQK